MDGRYWLTELDWITTPAHVRRFGRRSARVLTPNRQMDQWSSYNSSGALAPDFWTVAGSGATFARSTTTRRGPYSLSVTRAGTDATVSRTVSLLEDGVSADSLRGEKVTGVAVVRSGQSSSVTVSVADGVGTTTSSAHAGNSQFAEINTGEHTISASATTLTLTATVAVNETALIDELYLVFGTLDDTVRRDASRVEWLGGRPTFGENRLWLGPKRFADSIIVESERPYPEFLRTRVEGGTADADTSDAPLDLVAYGALARFFEGQVDARQIKYRKFYSALQAGHLRDDEGSQGGAQLLSGLPYGMRMAVR